MKLRPQQTKIELKVEDLENPNNVLMPLPAESLPKTAETQPARQQGQKAQIPKWLHGGQQIADYFLISIFGALINFFVALAVTFMIPGGRESGLINMLDVSVYISLTTFAIYLFCTFCPIWLGLLMLAFQAASGVFVGQVIVALICNQLSIDPQTLGPMQAVISCLFTILYTILPAFALPLYTAALESSPLQRTLAGLSSNYLIADLRGNRLTFRHAWKRALIQSFQSLQYLTSVARGENYRDRNSWIEQKTGAMHIRKQDTLDEEISKSKNTVRVRYRAFQELENFLGPETQNIPKVMKKQDVPFKRAYHGVLGLLLVTLTVLIPTIFQAPATFFRIFMLNGSFQSWWGPFLDNLSKVFVDWPGLFAFVTLFLAGYFTLAACRPTHIELTRDGIRFIFGIMPFFMQDKICPWSKVKQIQLEQVQGKASIADHKLVFLLTDGKKMRMRLGSIGSVVGKEEILKAVERWAPTTPRSAEVISALQPPCDFSYTELWMEALSAPPKREKLKPLIAGAMLREHQFTVMSMLGVGGQGTAYLAEDAMSGQSVVLKEFVLPVYVDVGARRRALEIFEKEARLLKELSHPNIVKLVDYFVEDHRVYLVLEHIDGDSLRTLVNRSGIMDETTVRQLTLQMCEILEYLHSRIPPVVHRDFTPDNLILRKDGTLKLIDFNVAQQTDESTVSSVVGKPAYLPPEQFRGTPTTQSDLYALGGCLQFLLTGEDPIAIISSNPSLTRDDISPELSSIVQKATEPELDARFATANEITELLQISHLSHSDLNPKEVPEEEPPDQRRNPI